MRTTNKAAVLLVASTATAFNIGPSGPGPAACASLTTVLGSKVSQPFTIDYYQSQQSYWNARQSQYAPSCVLFPTSAQDVSTAIKIIKSAKTRFAVKTAGHNPNTFFSSVDQGVLIDFSKMNQNTYDPTTTLGTFQPGQNFGEIYQYFSQYNRTVVGARLAGVGTGLALGGGLSYLSAQYGLACDSFRELEYVLPSGEIVTASPTQNSDLFFGARGGGGNAYGIVTKYTVQTRAAGTFYAGNIIYGGASEAAVLEATANFIRYNTDPKAAIITTFEMLGTPTVADLRLDAVALLFLVYDGPDPGTAFANFTAIPNVIANTLGPKTYLEAVNLPVQGTTAAGRGDNIFRVVAHRPDDGTWRTAVDAWTAWCAANKGSYTLSSLDIQPVPRSLTDASRAQSGGSALQLPDGPWFWINFLITTPTVLLPGQYDAIQASFRNMVNSVPSAPGLPLFLNDANADQKPLLSFSAIDRLRAVKAKYDPDHFFANYTGGWAFE